MYKKLDNVQLMKPIYLTPVPVVATAGPLRSARLPAIDLLRGLIAVLMTIDHARDFWSATPFRPEDPSQTSVALFVTRWVTHPCAPTFVLLAGLSAYLLLKKTGDKPNLSRFLITRGLWLMLLDVTVLMVLWQFGYQFVFLQVIWVIGCSMVILAGLIWLPRWAIIAVALVLTAGHNALDGWQPESAWWTVLHRQNGFLLAGKLPVFVAYPLLPWPGVMAAGYWLGTRFDRPESDRNRWLTRAGAVLLVVFTGSLSGDPSEEGPKLILISRIQAVAQLG